MTAPKMKPLRLWGGFVDGRLDVFGIAGKFYEYPNGVPAMSAAVFATRNKARRQYEDVRRIEIREISP